MTDAAQNGHEPVGVAGDPVDLVAMPRDLVQTILDYLVRCPAGDVYVILRRLDEQVVPLPPAPEEVANLAGEAAP